MFLLYLWTRVQPTENCMQLVKYVRVNVRRIWVLYLVWEWEVNWTFPSFALGKSRRSCVVSLMANVNVLLSCGNEDKQLEITQDCSLSQFRDQVRKFFPHLPKVQSPLSVTNTKGSFWRKTCLKNGCNFTYTLIWCFFAIKCHGKKLIMCNVVMVWL